MKEKHPEHPIFLLLIVAALRFEELRCKMIYIFFNIIVLFQNQCISKLPALGILSGELAYIDKAENIQCNYKYIEQLNLLHSVHTDNPVFGSAKASYCKQVEDASKFLTEEEGELMKQILEVLPEGDRLVHCDAHPKNIMIQNGEMLWIDMEGMSVGHPIYDLISIAVILNGMRTDEMTMGICGMDNATVKLFKDCFIRKYFKTEDPEMIQKMGGLLDGLRLIRAVFAIGFTTSGTEKYRPAIIEMARQHFFPNIQKIAGGIKFLVSSL